MFVSDNLFCAIFLLEIWMRLCVVALWDLFFMVDAALVVAMVGELRVVSVVALFHQDPTQATP